MSADRFYLDYNATSPLAGLVFQNLTSGDVFFGNPSSQHSTGKTAKKYINETRHYLYQTFGLNESSHRLFFHSGASEGVNTLLQVPTGEKWLIVISPIDHPCVRDTATHLEQLGHKTIFMPLNKYGEVDKTALITTVQKRQNEFAFDRTVINWTWVHNETGHVMPLSQLMELKQALNALVHVDAVQVPGKIAYWNKLSLLADAYTFSGHKFGALKGIGFSFVSPNWPLQVLIHGGGQQQGMRSGTENVLGIKSLQWALTELQEKFVPEQQLAHITLLRSELATMLKGKGEIICQNAKEKNLTTVYFILYGLASDMGLALFDQYGLEISAGSACSSGAAKKSITLESLGYSAHSRNGLRVSTSWTLTGEEVTKILAKFAQVLEKIPSH